MAVSGKLYFGPFFYFALIVLVPVIWLGVVNANKLLDIYITHANNYELAPAKLITNQHRKYNNNATFQFNYQGQTLQGEDGSMMWASVGDRVTIYFEKSNPSNNGILNELIFLAVGQWLLALALSTYLITKLIKHGRTS